MAITFQAASFLNYTSTSGSKAFDAGSGSNRIMLAFVSNAGGTDTITGATFNGVAMTEMTGSPVSVVGIVKLHGYFLYAPATGSHNFASTRSGSGDTWNVYGVWNGVSQSGFPDASQFTSSAGTSPYTGTVTTVADNCWTVLTCTNNGAAAVTASTGSTFRVNNTSSLAIFDSNAAKTPAGSTSMSFTSTNVSTGFIMVSLAPVAATSSIKTFDELAYASTKTVNGLALASVKTWNGLA